MAFGDFRKHSIPVPQALNFWLNGSENETSTFLKIPQRIPTPSQNFHIIMLNWNILLSCSPKGFFSPPPQAGDESPGFPQTVLLKTILNIPERKICKVNLIHRLYSKEQEINLLYSWHVEIMTPKNIKILKIFLQYWRVKFHF